MSQFTGATPTRTIGVSFVVAVILAALPAAALAADEPAPGLLFNAEAALLYDDNVYRTKSDEQSDGIAVFKPALAWAALWRANQFDLGYQGDFGRYFNESDLDYNNNTVGAHLLLDHSDRVRTNYTLGYERKTDQTGSTDQLSVKELKPDKWHNSHAGFKINYGSTTSQGELALQTLYNEKRYTNNGQEYRDYDSTGGVLTFYYRVAPVTRVLLEVGYADYDFIEQDIFGSDQSGGNFQVLSGVAWEATGKTTGVFKIGYRDRTYDDDRFDSRSGFALFLDGTWRPNTYTRVTFGAAQDNRNSAQRGTNGYVDTYGYLDVVRDISERTRLKADVRYTNEDFDDIANRDDNRWDASVGLEYSLLHRLDVGIAYRYQSRDSNLDIYDFTGNTIVLSASTRLWQ